MGTQKVLQKAIFAFQNDLFPARAVASHFWPRNPLSGRTPRKCSRRPFSPFKITLFLSGPWQAISSQGISYMMPGFIHLWSFYHHKCAPRSNFGGSTLQMCVSVVNRIYGIGLWPVFWAFDMPNSCNCENSISPDAHHARVLGILCFVFIQLYNFWFARCAPRSNSEHSLCQIHTTVKLLMRWMRATLVFWVSNVSNSHNC